MSFNILGTGSALPASTLTNDDLSRIVDTSDEWIISKTGIKKRGILNEESISDISEKAARQALENSGTAAHEIDLIIGATIAGDYRTPSLAAVMSERLGVKCPAFDVNSACSGFVYALDVAAGFFLRKKVKKVLIVCAEAMSRVINWQDRATCVLFGDGAGAVVLGDGNGYLSSKLTCEGNTELLVIKCPEKNLLNNAETDVFLHMNGQEVYRFAVSAMAADVADVIKDAGLTTDDITYILPHQANLRIIKAGTEKLGIGKEKVLANIEEHGNMSSASIPVLMDETNKNKMLKSGDILVLTAFGGGLTTGACVIRWA